MEPNTPEAANQPQDTGLKLGIELKSWGRDILFAVVIAIFIVIFIVQPVKVEGTSMQPRLID